ncbi:DUF6807 family protein [Rhodopirellula sallentina]|uniref:Putative secreted protein n=1 Tax=Rhodopirellula sallentina SM41 TaxID=1263870 RepID=M5UJL2_9BACT|nr:DUF6807 family protein [Rhodopirellula sallentina]EMI58041.1 putative secreted protein [Rhodopirellula sallentina SM41]
MSLSPRIFWIIASVISLTFCHMHGVAADNTPATSTRIAVEIADDESSLTLRIDQKPAFVYRCDSSVDLPHFDPFLSASGRPMTVKISKDHPHHRSFWVAEERVHLEGQPKPVGLYMALYSGVTDKEKSPWPIAPYQRRVSHVAFSNVTVAGNEAEFDEKLTWMDGDTPLLDELRHYRVVALADGEYFLDFSFRLQATYGDVTIKRDATHYAIPYIRMSDPFTVKKGSGKVVNSEGGVNESGTHDKLAYWVDYSATMPDDSGFEGITCMIHPDQKPPHLWLIRDYGTWGPRGATGYHNATFTIAEGDQYDQHVGMLVHRGNAQEADIAKRYQDYCDGKL